MKRQFDPAVLEMMDRPQPVSPELTSDLQNIRRLNRYFGSYSLIRYFLRRWLRPGERLNIVDLATGSGDIPRLIIEYARSIGANIRIDALDRQPATLEVARSLSANYPEISFVEANMLNWQPNESYDLVLCSLALHHFSEEEAVRILGCCRKWSRKYVLVADICRGKLASGGIYLLTALIFREPMTRFDARLSVQRAFSFAEMQDLAQRAGWQQFGHRRFHIGRQAIWME